MTANSPATLLCQADPRRSGLAAGRALLCHNPQPGEHALGRAPARAGRSRLSPAALAIPAIRGIRAISGAIRAIQGNPLNDSGGDPVPDSGAIHRTIRDGTAPWHPNRRVIVPGHPGSASVTSGNARPLAHDMAPEPKATLLSEHDRNVIERYFPNKLCDWASR